MQIEGGMLVRTVAFIPIRGGSKSIPLKNIRSFCGKPLVYWTAKAASDAESIHDVYLATDSEEIKNTVMDFRLPKVKVIGRSAGTATDTATTESAMLEFAEQHEFDSIVLIQATSPMLSRSDLEEGLALYKSGGYDSLLSVVEQKRFIWTQGEDGYQPWNYRPENRLRRQEMKSFYVENGAFYITSRERLLQTGSRLSGRVGIYAMDERSYFEIDEPSDWQIMETLCASVWEGREE